MITPQADSRQPATWEANLLAGGQLVVLLVLSAILTLLLPLPAVIVTTQILFIVPALIWSAARRFPLRVIFRLQPISMSTAAWSLLIGVICWPVAAGLSTLLDRLLSRIGPYPGIPLPENWVEVAAYALTFMVIAPLTEEPVYRGFILQAWLRRGALTGVLVSGILFGLVHSQIAPFLPISVLGVVLGLLAYRSGSVLASILAHASYNAVATLFVVLPALQRTPDGLIILAGGIALPLAVLAVWAFVRRGPQPTVPLPPAETSSGVWRWITLLGVLGLFGLMVMLEIFMRLNPLFAGM